ncbi:immunoglobulin-like domain-containing protein, partial [Arcobacter defluvii]
KTDLYVLLDNEQLITIKAGELSGSVTTTLYTDDRYIQGDRTYDISISNAEGGGYEKLDTSSKLDIIVKDDADVTKIVLSAPHEVIEGDEIIVTATVDKAPKTDLYVLLDNEQLITIKAGELSGSVTTTLYTDDRYIQGDRTYDISISNAEGGGYEKLDTSSKLDIIVKDDADVTTVSINKIEVPEEITIYRANSTTENTGKSNLVYLENRTDNLLLQGYIKDDELYQIEMKDFYIKNNAWGKDEQGSFLEFVLTIPEPITNDLIFLANNLLKPKNSFEENSNNTEFITIKAGETTGIGKYYITEFKDLPYTDEPREYGTGAIFAEDASSSNYSSFFSIGGNDFKLNINGDSTIDTTTIDIAEVIDNIDGTMTLKIELSNPPIENGRIGGSGSVSFFVNGEHYRIPFEHGVQEYYLTIEKKFDTNGSIKITHFNADAYFEDISIPDKMGDSSVAVIIKQGYDTYEIETSNPPDGNKYNFVNTFPIATIEKTSIDYSNNVTKEIYEVNLDKNGKGTLVINTDSTQKSTNLKILEIGGNFEKVDFVNNDINLSNLENIITDNNINLRNEKIDNVNITLEDVLKLAPQKELTINCDNFDNLNFKNTISNGTENNWSKATGSGIDSGYDIYTNSGDLSIQVKVEQPISDGITN